MDSKQTWSNIYPRYDLQGEICGEVTAEEAAAAQQEVEALYVEQEAKRQERGPRTPVS